MWVFMYSKMSKSMVIETIAYKGTNQRTVNCVILSSNTVFGNRNRIMTDKRDAEMI